MEFKEDKKEKERKGKQTKWVRTHFMSRMFPGEYCTNSVLIRNPHSTHLYISISISLSALSSQSYTHVLRKGGTGHEGLDTRFSVQRHRDMLTPFYLKYQTQNHLWPSYLNTSTKLFFPKLKNRKTNLFFTKKDSEFVHEIRLWHPFLIIIFIIILRHLSIFSTNKN